MQDEIAALREQLAQREREIAAWQQRFRNVIARNADGIVVLSLEGNIRYINPAGEQMFGRTAAEMQGALFGYPLVVGETTEIDILRGTGGVCFAEMRLVQTEWDGAPALLACLHDMTARRQTEETLRLFQSAVSNANEAVVICKADKQDPASSPIVYVNAAFTRMTGYTQDEVSGKNPRFLQGARSSRAQRSRIREALVAHETVSAEIINYTKQGEEYWVELTIVPIFDSFGQLTHFLSVQRDITSRKQAEQALQESETRFRSVVEGLGEGLMITDFQGRVLYVNQRMTELSHYTTEEILEHTAYTLFLSPDDWSDLARPRALVRQGESVRLERMFRRKGGSAFWAEVNLTPFRAPGRKIIGILYAITDITERKEAREALERSHAELQQFANIASHDLKEPLRMVAGYTQLLARRYQGKLDQDADDFIAYAVDGAKRMQELINGLLAYSRVESQKRPVEPVASEEALRWAIENLKTVIAETGARVTFRAILPVVMADPTQLGQLFQNLIANALRFHGESPPEIEISAELQASMWRFAVRDNGVGIAPQHHERIFLIFQRVPQNSPTQGTGVGLTICKRIVERHGGRIWVESEEGKGATFYFTLPPANPIPDSDPLS